MPLHPPRLGSLRRTTICSESSCGNELARQMTPHCSPPSLFPSFPSFLSFLSFLVLPCLALSCLFLRSQLLHRRLVPKHPRCSRFCGAAGAGAVPRCRVCRASCATQRGPAQRAARSAAAVVCTRAGLGGGPLQDIFAPASTLCAGSAPHFGLPQRHEIRVGPGSASTEREWTARRGSVPFGLHCCCSPVWSMVYACAMMHCDVLCCAVLCCAVLCCAVL